jgi:hypothetical protein
MNNAYSITIETDDGHTFTTVEPSKAIEWLHNLPTWNAPETALETKCNLAEAAEVWSGKEVSVATAWDFLQGMSRAGVLSVTFNSKSKQPNDNRPS